MIFKRKSSPGDIIIDSVIVLFLLAIFIICFYPFWNIIIISLNDKNDSLKGGLFLWPRVPTLASYVAVMQNSQLLAAAGVSLARTVVGTVNSLFFTTLLAYGMSKKDMFGSKAIGIFFVFTMYFGGGLVPYYMVLKTVKLIDTFWVYILPSTIGIYNMILVRIYIESLPSELEESAKIDGANDFIILFRIIIPLCKPILATVGLFIAVSQWNSWFDTNLFTYRSSLKTLQFLLVQILNQYDLGTTQSNASILQEATQQRGASVASIRMATTVIATLPIILVYPFVQKYFVKGMMIGAVKT